MQCRPRRVRDLVKPEVRDDHEERDREGASEQLSEGALLVGHAGSLAAVGCPLGGPAF